MDLAAEDRLREADRHLADDVRPLAHEERMLADVEDHVEVAGRRGPRSGLALATQLEARAVVDAGRDLDVQLLRPALGAAATARRTRVGDDRPLTVAVAAGLGDREEPLLEAHLARAAALGAGARRRARLRAPPAARLAGREARDRDGLLAAEGGLLEADLELVAEVLAPSRPPTSAAPAAGAEEVAEQIADDVLEAGAEVEAGAGSAALLEGGVPEAVVEIPPPGIGEHLVGLGDLLEPLLGRGSIVGVAVGMELERETAVRLLDLVVVRAAGDAENLVVVALHGTPGASPARVSAPVLSAPPHRKRERGYSAPRAVIP